MKVSEKGLAELAGHEGIVLSPYKDSVGLWTIGVGHLMKGQEEIRKECELSMKEVIALLMEDVEQCEMRVRKAFLRPLTQTQFDAAVSFDFNTGAIHRASWVRYFNEGENGRAEEAFMLWRKPPEILPRREKEKILFFEGVYQLDGSVRIYPVSAAGRPIWRKGRTCNFLEEVRYFFDECKQGVNREPRAKGRLGFKFSSPEETNENALVRPWQKDEVVHCLARKFASMTPEERRDDKVKLLFCCGYDTNIAEGSGQERYRDALFLLSPEGIQSFNSNADHFSLRTAVAMIKAPQAIHYKPKWREKTGKNPCLAFLQSTPCEVQWDNRGDNREDDKVMYAVDLCRVGDEKTRSAGCLAIPGCQWDEFCEQLSASLLRHGQKTLFLTLLFCSKEEALRHTLENKKASREDV